MVAGGNVIRLTPFLALQELFKSCMELEEESDIGKGWTALKSRSKDVKMSMKYFPPKKGERSVSTGRAEGIVDSSAEDVAAWQFNFCSNERTRHSLEAGDPARFVVENNAAVNEVTYTTVKAMPFPLKNRGESGEERKTRVGREERNTREGCEVRSDEAL